MDVIQVIDKVIYQLHLYTTSIILIYMQIAKIKHLKINLEKSQIYNLIKITKKCLIIYAQIIVITKISQLANIM